MLSRSFLSIVLNQIVCKIVDVMYVIDLNCKILGAVKGEILGLAQGRRDIYLLNPP